MNIIVVKDKNMGFQICNGVLKKYTKEKGVTEIVIPDGVQRIGERAFSCLLYTSPSPRDRG
mgnify:CR=1 FL=1